MEDPVLTIKAMPHKLAYAETATALLLSLLTLYSHLIPKTTESEIIIVDQVVLKIDLQHDMS